MLDDRAQSNIFEEIVPPVLIALGTVSLLRTSRFLSLALFGGWIYTELQKSDAAHKIRGAVSDFTTADIDEEIESSFPASDPPSFSGTTAGAPD